MSLYRNIGGVNNAVGVYVDPFNLPDLNGGGGTLYTNDPVVEITSVTDVKQEPAQSVYTAPVTEQTQVRAAVFEDGSNKMLFGATVSLLSANGSLVGQPVTLAADSNTFTVYSNDPNTELVAIGKDGYIGIVIPVSILLDMPEVYLKKGSSNNMLLIGAAGLGFLLLTRKKKRVGAFSDVVNVPNVLAVSAAVLAINGFKWVQNILDALGLGKSKAGAEEANPDSAFKPTYWQKFTTFPAGAITESTAQNYASAIYHAFTWLNDDYSTILGVFSSLKSKAQVSFVAWKFQKEYGGDLLSYLTNGELDVVSLPWDGLSKDHINTIISLVNSLPSN